MLLLKDFETVFDSINLKFIVSTFEIFGFGDEFIRWITIILGIKEGTNIKAVMVMNGYISTPIDVKRGYKQGDPISGYLFILVLEILALLLQKQIVKLYRTKSKIDNLLDIYADDLSVNLEFYKKEHVAIQGKHQKSRGIN